MLPIILDASRLQIALIGTGPRAERRLALLHEGGATQVTVLAQAPETFVGFDLVYFTEADADAAIRAREAGALVNVEDVLELCDFHTPAIKRRGALTLSVSTDGRCAGLSSVLAEYLGKLFDLGWALRVSMLEAKRRTWRKQGLTHPEIRARLAQTVAQAGWLPDLPVASPRSQSQNSDTLRKTSLGGGHTIK